MTTTSAPRFDVLVFCQQLLSLLEAGLQLVEAVETLAAQERGAQQRVVISHLHQSMLSGLPLSQALAQWPSVFPPLFQAAVQASEQTGGVAVAIQRFVVYETQLQKLRSSLKAALIYPALLLSLGGLVVAFLLGYVVPRFSVVFEDRLTDMPYLSGLVVRLGLQIAEQPTAALLIVGAALLALAVLVLHPALRRAALVLASQAPWLGPLMRQFELVRLYRALAMLLRGGIPALQSLQRVATMASLQSGQSVGFAAQAVSEGQPLAQALRQAGLTTAVSERLLAVGDRSGQVGDMLERAADFMDTDLARAIERATRLLEPVLMLGMGVLIGGIVMLMYLPIFELADSVGG